MAFIWQDEQERAFCRIKELLTSDTVMAYFDANKTTELVTDASPWGIPQWLCNITEVGNEFGGKCSHADETANTTH